MPTGCEERMGLGIQNFLYGKYICHYSVERD